MRRAFIVPLLALALSGAWSEEGSVPIPPTPSAAPAAQADQQAAIDPSVDSTPYSVASHIDWKRRVLVIDISLDFKKAGLALPEGRLTAARLVSRDLSGLAKDSLFSIPLDSEGRIGDRILSGDLGIEAILSLAGALVHVDDAMSGDLLTFRSRWELPLSRAAALFVDWKQKRPLPEPLGWTASRAYTGIIIYADAPLPVYGERGVTATLSRCLFPRIFDEAMGTVMNRWVVEPEVLTDQGPLGYIGRRSADDEARVGDDPLLIRAVGLFGIRRTDLIISSADAARILADPANRDLVANGRILVVVPRDPPSRAAR